METTTEYLERWTPSRESLKELFGVSFKDPEFEGYECEFGEALSERSCEDGESIKINDIYSLTIADSFGGEGQGDQYWFVFSVDKDGVAESFWKVPGWYQSYNGGEYEFNGVHEVESREVVVTKWFKKQ